MVEYRGKHRCIHFHKQHKLVPLGPVATKFNIQTHLHNLCVLITTIEVIESLCERNLRTA